MTGWKKNLVPLGDKVLWEIGYWRCSCVSEPICTPIRRGNRIYKLSQTKLNRKKMKKIIVTLLFAIVSSLAFVSCTEEEIAPSSGNGGGVFEEPVKR